MLTNYNLYLVFSFEVLIIFPENLLLIKLSVDHMKNWFLSAVDLLAANVEISITPPTVICAKHNKILNDDIETSVVFTGRQHLDNSDMSHLDMDQSNNWQDLDMLLFD